MDLTQLWVLSQKLKKRGVGLILALLIFAAGWQTGKIMSPYYASHPIIFEDRQCEECSSSGGTKEEIISLQEEGTNKRNIAKNTTASTVAGTKTANTTGKFVGSVNSDLFHHPDCSNNIKESNKVWFNSTEEAAAAGYKPSKCTQQKLTN